MAWRETATSPKLFVLDARSLFPLGMFFLHMSWITFYIACVGVMLFSVLERMKIGPLALLIIVRSWLMGKNRIRVDDVVFRRRSRGQR